MVLKSKEALNIISNMGFRYILFRGYYALITKLSLQKKRFPKKPPFKLFITIEEWKENLPPFFFYGKNIHSLPKQKNDTLKAIVDDIKNGTFVFFSKQKFNLGIDYNWFTNPTTGFKYNINKHWSEIQDFSAIGGDIKFIWEKARFSYLYDIIRYDYHFKEDQSQFVFSEIEDFIDKNPINQGPNYKCSQEISLRVLNWTFALYYYKDSFNLTDVLFKKIMNVIYWQLHHVYYNIHFSRIAVRNNHAITETLMLYLSNILFPFIPETKKWSKKGKKWFEKEIDYQIYNDGTFLQFSMNYHRVVVQLLTWAIKLSELNKDHFKPLVYERAKKSLEFLDASSDPVSGQLPNYGSNDGALFFKLTNDDYRNYRSQLDDLRLVLENKTYFISESSYWYGLNKGINIEYKFPKEVNTFNEGGYYIIQDKDSKTFIRCGKYKDRPFQADNLHIDIWIKGINVLRDSGTFKYNTKKEFIHYFNGCEGHNTVSISKEDQMLKGERFIWYNWIKQVKSSLKKENGIYVFKGSIKAFKNLGNSIYHHRTVTKKVSQNIWNIVDIIENIDDKTIYQYWHIHPDYFDKVYIETQDKNHKILKPLLEEKWYSGYYGVKERSIRITFATNTNIFNTQISVNL